MIKKFTKRITAVLAAATIAMSMPVNAFASSDYERTAVVNYALGFVGNRYVWGGTDPYSGADCSGFVQYVMKNAINKTLPRVSSDQAMSGRQISAAEAQPGDLIFYDTRHTGGVSHVAIYLGGGKICHAAGKRSGVIVSDADYRRPIKIMNVID